MIRFNISELIQRAEQGIVQKFLENSLRSIPYEQILEPRALANGLVAIC
jgi:hypothetical protein